MNARYQALAEKIEARFGGRVHRVESHCGELTFEVAPDQLIAVATVLRDDREFCFETLIDLCAVDYLTWGVGEWKTEDATNSGFSRAAFRETILPEPDDVYDERRFAVVYHLLSVSLNHRLRLRAFTGHGNPPLLPSVIDVWAAASWYEREAFDLFGILFEGHPDLRRLLTDYGFIGHPFRKDFPISGNVEVRYDPVQGRVIYQPVTIEPRVLVPRIVRDDNRYSEALRGDPAAEDEHG